MAQSTRLVSSGSESAKTLGLTEEERKELLPSGTQPVFTNRIAWARAHLTMAGLLEKTGKGRFRITQRGKEAMASNPSTINMRFLLQFPEYAEARSKAKTDTACGAGGTCVRN